MDNKSIAKVFDEMGDILDIKGADFFRINAYKKAALTIVNLPQDLRDIVDKNPQDLPKIPGIGKGMADKIIELVRTGQLTEHEKLKKGFPTGLLEMLKIRGLGPKKVKLLFWRLGIKNIKELKKAAERHKIQKLEGMGPKSEEEILKSIDEHAKYSFERMLLNEATEEASRIINYMKKCKEINKIEYAGSLRRKKETIGDIDLLVTVDDIAKTSEKIMKHFITYDDVIKVVAEGKTKSTIVLSSGMDVDLRVIDKESFGAAFHYFTGNKDHNIRIRDLAKKKGLKVNEYGVFKGKKLIMGKTEEDVFNSVGLPYIIPEIRRDRGEIEYGLQNKKFPKFIELKDIKGDLHSHTVFSDGKNTIEEMANAYLEKGYYYFAVADHSSVVGVTTGMGKKDIKKQWEEINKLNKKLKGKIKILKSSEVDILKDGSLDFGDEVLEELDLVIISVHLYFRLSPEEQTKRLIAAIENPYSSIFAHPTSRLINKRPSIKFNMEKVIEACIANNVVLEINSNPLRLDLPDNYVKMAKDKGAKFSIATDAHNIGHQSFMQYGTG
ncbi:MAG: DNA polymerase/3'-5' exonuclease PolX, partial [Candidatus Moranbacteria bacterium]|nr:DNA polymerase/3'-5' exonuclease PolX [Candidatus Moranbacteria bacterium]